MGRKQKLRQAKRSAAAAAAKKDPPPTNTATTNNSSNNNSGGSSVVRDVDIRFPLRQAKRSAAAAAAKKDPPPTNTATTNNSNNNNSNKNNDDNHDDDNDDCPTIISGISTIARTAAAVGSSVVRDVDIRFPISNFYNRGTDTNTDQMERLDLLKRGAIEHGCIHSMIVYAQFRLWLNNRKAIVHSAIPWYLEGAIRGSGGCVTELLATYRKDKVVLMKALSLYWTKMFPNFADWDNRNSDLYTQFDFDGLYEQKQHFIERSCAICGKEDTETLTLKQCIGCSACCYCSQECQTAHWEEHNHRGECKQVKILNKYHKPYAKEIREAVIRGDNNIPALEKLRYKLGLSRPLEDYVDLDLSDKGINFRVGRKDGTLWAGSFPGPIGQHVYLKGIPFSSKTISSW